MPSPKPLHALHHFARSRPRLTLAAILGIACALALPASWLLLTRILFGWNITVWLYLISMAHLTIHATHAKVRTIAAQQDKKGPIVLAIMSAAAVASLCAIVLELAQVKGLGQDQRMLHYGFTAITVLGSWLLLGTLFTFHYAHMFYQTPSHARPLAFPGTEPDPDYWDFLYFSLTIAVAAQTSDVTVLTRPMRKIVLGQSVLSFFFNLAVLGLSINIAASLVG
jgi:uncharacterized membrane protein